jgi:hypothetical protein
MSIWSPYFSEFADNIVSFLCLFTFLDPRRPRRSLCMDSWTKNFLKKIL